MSDLSDRPIVGVIRKEVARGVVLEATLRYAPDVLGRALANSVRREIQRQALEQKQETHPAA